MAPPKRNTQGIQVRLHQATLSALDEMAAKDPAAPSRQELIRRILREHLATHGFDVSEH
ncbi:ribbon-helix-helix protein, CopG family [Jannaschia sp. Os4]|uniref:ribbon-helix-helix domain-containing protein n=1 Tax=Jannaschia sp. Os4 TaxID=2807617 RepID=UPI001939DD4D|nr:CopG family transcriptional regulator [Jannaschia sp. Os4]MBM2576398.1 ribbon-helix-helix protein, CopG family [Jannaschia sp. Os4]